MENAHTKGTADCLAHFGVNEATGLTPDQFKKNLAKYGHNGENLGHVGGEGGVHDCMIASRTSDARVW